jgi:hypothetical protein
MAKILSGIGQMLHVPAMMAALSAPVAWIFGETEGTWAFLLTATAAVVPGQLLFRIYRNK